jgi:hypothetical protein
MLSPRMVIMRSPVGQRRRGSSRMEKSRARAEGFGESSGCLYFATLGSDDVQLRVHAQILMTHMPSRKNSVPAAWPRP